MIGKYEKILNKYDYKIVERDPNKKVGIEGIWMVYDSLDPNDFCIVGNDKENLAIEALNFLELNSKTKVSTYDKIFDFIGNNPYCNLNDISFKLHLSEKTVKKYLKNLVIKDEIYWFKFSYDRKTKDVFLLKNREFKIEQVDFQYFNWRDDVPKQTLEVIY